MLDDIKAKAGGSVVSGKAGGTAEIRLPARTIDFAMPGGTALPVAAIAEAITEVDTPDGVLVLLDLGSAVLSASNLTHGDVAAATPRPRALVAFYPGCDAELKRGYRPSAPLQLLVGMADDWTNQAEQRIWFLGQLIAA